MPMNLNNRMGGSMNNKPLQNMSSQPTGRRADSGGGEMKRRCKDCSKRGLMCIVYDFHIPPSYCRSYSRKWWKFWRPK